MWRRSSSPPNKLRWRVKISKPQARRNHAFFANRTRAKNARKFSKKNGLFILPLKNGEYAIIQGEGYVDIPIATGKEVIPLFFERHEDKFHIWQYRFNAPAEYNSIELVQSRCYKITTTAAQ
jgi:hypothetical protein